MTTIPSSSRKQPTERVPGWTRRYREHITTPEDAVKTIQPGQRVFLEGMSGVPRTLIKALVERAPELHDVELLQMLTFGEADYVNPGIEQHIRTNTMFISPNVRQAVNEGRADFTPIRLFEIPNLCRNLLHIDVALIQVSPPDDDGFCSFGVEVGISKPAAFAADRIIAEVNPQMPYTRGDSFIHVSRLDQIVEVDYPLPEVGMGSGDPIELAIGEHVVGLIDDGATLQMGIGGIPDGVLYRLRTAGLRDLGIHTEMFSDGVIDLMEMGVITNARKTIHRGKFIAGFMLGSQRLYSFVHDNAMIEMHPIDYTNDPFIIAQNEKMTAINSAIEVDFTGQVCADSIGHRFFSGVGGQVDFVRGAARSKGGKPIIALPSTARDDTVSRIVPALKTGAGVVTSRNDVHYVVTEHGVAYLHGQTVRNRVQAMINIAHPKFRDELTAQAKALNYL
ncbi:MAG: acetyl-CoA hydrolase/transferase family protein [Chloroflexaceae bacterium]